MAADDVELTDLEVIARYSLALRRATAPRTAVIAALESDLAWLRAAAPARPVPQPAGERGVPRATRRDAPSDPDVRRPVRRAREPR